MIYTQTIEGWRVIWESVGEHRFWCLQTYPSNLRLALVVMLNPGSLKGVGSSLSKDDTLRTLRAMFKGTSYNLFIINLFTLATVDPSELFLRWIDRDHPSFSYDTLSAQGCSAVMFAYGDYENGTQHALDIKQRVKEVRDKFNTIKHINVPTNASGTPMHPRRIKFGKMTEVIRAAILCHASQDMNFQLSLLDKLCE